MRETAALIRKEINSYFASAIALIFVGVFSLGALFVFFYVEGFWARNIADVRPLFRWLPVLLIFLASALTMRQWSEEQANGTLEMLLILPVRLVQLVLAKFLSALALIAFALALTLVLPVTVATLGNLDLGPVVGGYVAALLLAAMYVSVGLFISSRTDNQLVALILSVLANGAFYLAGSTVVVQSVSGDVADWLRVIGSGARFDSIERGVLDLRDLAYFVTITVAFLALNVLSLDSRRWGKGPATRSYRFNLSMGMALLVINALLVNVWLYPLRTARVDLTENNLYSLSDVTKDTLDELAEPLLIRAYVSEATIPDLEPLIPQLEDTLREYEVAGDGTVTVEIIDPDEEQQSEAETVYGISPTPAQISDRLETSIINFYFDILLVYGDQSTVLTAGDLIEVDQFSDTAFEFRFANLEYDLTSSIRKLVTGFQSVDAVLEGLSQPATFTLYYTATTLPETYVEAPAILQTIADDLNATGNFVYTAIDLDDPNASTTPDALYQQYQIEPLATDFFQTTTFYLHALLTVNNRTAVIRLAPAATEAEYREIIDGTIKRMTGGFLPVVGVWTPPTTTVDQFGQQQPTLQVYEGVAGFLGENYEVRPLDLTTGSIAGDIDMVLLVNPQNLTQPERYAIDQYLMVGGTVVVTTSSHQYTFDPFTQWLSVTPVQGGVTDMLATYGVVQDSRVVMDFQAMSFLDVDSQGRYVQYQAPHFIDVREENISNDSLMTTGLVALTMPFASSLTVSAADRVDVEQLVFSSDNAWDSTNTRIQPDATGGYTVDGPQGRRLLAVALTGQFDSFFAQPDGAIAEPTAPNALPDGIAVQPLTRSPEDTRLVVIGSAEFLSDLTSQLTTPSRVSYASLFLQNIVDWALSDSDLLAIRTPDSQLRLLDRIEGDTPEAREDFQRNTEVVAYVFVIMVLLVLAGMWRVFRRGERPMPLWEEPSGPIAA